MVKKNCWEVKKCGREENGANAVSLGVCPAANDYTSDGINSGKNGGRICWAVTGTFCGGKVQGSFAQKQISCMVCEVYKEVKREEGRDFRLLKPGQIYKKTG